ncbi:MAG: SUMF1/EgtB/PvdO family nonheme iron enzyme [Deltaproteobacteria bacterium]|nr:SUMF1/EgtB/PvdO family nonheme iron enzyme [Deltaproteobacteria bacterium]
MRGKSAALGALLLAGACTLETDVLGPTPASCPAPLADCGGMCVQLALDRKNCGACGAACAQGEVCSAGECGLECVGNTTKCSGKCVDVQLDAANCGGCDTACAPGEVCSAGKCALDCVGGTVKCSDKCVDTALDAANCGGCGKACAQGEVCSNGGCGLVCAGGTSKCGSKCADTGTDPANCGSCGNACGPWEVCSAGKCCSFGLGSCAPSCAGGGPGRSDCGPNKESCCKNESVLGGSFYRSYDGVDYKDQSFPATLSTFNLDVYEITVGRFRVFAEAGKGTQQSPPAPGAGAHPKIADSGWQQAWTSDKKLEADKAALKTALKCSPSQTWTDSAGANEKLPINCITWYEAFAFCAWDGGRLPTEAEWNYAAAGGSEQRYYPWSNPPSSTAIDSSYAVYFCLGDGKQSPDCSLADILAVGSRSPKGDGRWGQADLGGSMWEWVLDWYAAPYPDKTCNNCANLVAASLRVGRGGCWFGVASGLLSADRGDFYPSFRGLGVGSRCARTP